MNFFKQDKGFTLIEVLVVIIIIAGLAAIAIPRLAASTVNARQKADIATAHQVKAALDRYQIENGAYPKGTDLTVKDGTVSCEGFIPQYISKLDNTTTQQVVPEDNKGFGVEALDEDNTIPDADTVVSHTIMIYLSEDGTAAEVRAYDEGLDLEGVLWTSAN